MTLFAAQIAPRLCINQNLDSNMTTYFCTGCHQRTHTLNCKRVRLGGLDWCQECYVRRMEKHLLTDEHVTRSINIEAPVPLRRQGCILEGITTNVVDIDAFVQDMSVYHDVLRTQFRERMTRKLNLSPTDDCFQYMDDRLVKHLHCYMDHPCISISDAKSQMEDLFRLEWNLLAMTVAMKEIDMRSTNKW